MRFGAIKRLHVQLGFVLPTIILACGTIIHGTTQEIGISSQPTGASVTIDNESRGITPLVADLKRKNRHLVKVEMAGYEPFEMHVTKSVSGWVWGNIVFGGLVGLAVDAISGGLYKLSPEQIMAELRTSGGDGAGLELRENTIYLSVVLRPDPSWERIGTLETAAEEGE